MSFSTILKNKFLIYTLLALVAIFYFGTKDLYSVTAYSNHPISINKEEFRDYRFASNRKTYFGGIAAAKHIPFGTEVELIPLTKADERAINKHLKGRTKFIVEDRGFLVKGKVIDIFFPRRLGGHNTAKRWGRRTLKIKLNKPKDQKKK